VGGNSPQVGKAGVAKWGMTGRTVEPLLQNLTHRIQMLTYFTNHNHLQTVLMGNGDLAHQKIGNWIKNVKNPCSGVSVCFRGISRLPSAFVFLR